MNILFSILLLIAIIFAILYVLFISLASNVKFPNDGYLSFKQMNKFFWVFFKEFWGFSSPRYDDKPW